MQYLLYFINISDENVLFSFSSEIPDENVLFPMKMFYFIEKHQQITCVKNKKA